MERETLSLLLVLLLPFSAAVVTAALGILMHRKSPDSTLALKVTALSKTVAVMVALAEVVLMIVLGMQLEISETSAIKAEVFHWLPQFGVSFALGLNGISFVVLLLTTVTFFIAVLAAAAKEEITPGYLTQLLALEGSVIGVLLSLDLVQFYLFWELMLIPAYFLIGIWGGENRVRATLTFVLYTVASSVLMLLGIIALGWAYYLKHGTLSFLISSFAAEPLLSPHHSLLVFAAFVLAFAVKIPLFPFHSWLADAYEEAPTTTTMVLSGVLGKLGLFGFLHIVIPIFPNLTTQYAPILAALAVVGIVYGAFAAWGQTKIKRLLAYSSFSHVGFCALGIFSLSELASSGALFQMVAHACSISGLFLLAGVLAERTGCDTIDKLGGVAGNNPGFSTLFMIFTFAAIAVPLSAGFIGEFLILSGSFAELPALTVIASTAVVFGAVYMLSLYRRIFFGETGAPSYNITLRPYEVYALIPLTAFIVMLGVMPQFVLDSFSRSLFSLSRTREKQSVAYERAITKDAVDKMQETEGGSGALGVSKKLLPIRYSVSVIE